MRKILSVIVASLALLAGGALTAAPAQAGTCIVTSCYDKDPVTTGCGDGAYTIWAYGYDEVRYSPSCQAAWIRSNSPAHFLGQSTATTMRTYNNATGGTIIWRKDVPLHSKKISNMIPLRPTQFIQVELKTGYYSQFTPMLNTVRI